MYGYKCEYCDGTVREQVVKREAFKYRDGFVILENVPVGVCDQCDYRYYHSSLLHRVEEICTQREVPERMELVPVAAAIDGRRAGWLPRAIERYAGNLGYWP